MAVKGKGTGTFSRKRRVLIALNVAAMTLIAFALFAGLCYLASLPAFRVRADLTRQGSFTLSPLTLRLLETLKKEVEVISIFRTPYMDLTGRAYVEKRVGDYTNKLLEEYVIRSHGRVTLEVLDRDRDNLRVQELNEKIGLSDENTVIVRCGDNHLQLFADDLAKIDAGGTDPTTNVYHPPKIRSYKAEAALTFAIQSVVEERKPEVYFTTGRSEANPDDGGREGMRIAGDMLKRLNFEVKILKLYAERAVPDSCAVLVIPGPREEFSPEEVAAVRSYLARGGRLFLALSPGCTESLAPVLGDFHVGLNPEITCVESPVPLPREDRHRKSYIQTKSFARRSRITRPLADRGVFCTFYKAGAVNRSQEDTAVTELVLSPEKSWGDAHPPGVEGDYFYNAGTETLGPRVLGVAVEGKDALQGARLVFFADTYFYTNYNIQRWGRANLDLFTNCVNWLAARENLLEIPPKSLEVSQVDLTEEEYHRIGIYVVVMIPALAAVAGMVVWWLRRR